MSRKLVAAVSLSTAPEMAVMDSGTSCRRSARLRAVTTTESSDSAPALGLVPSSTEAASACWAAAGVMSANGPTNREAIATDSTGCRRPQVRVRWRGWERRVIGILWVRNQARRAGADAFAVEGR